METGWLGTTYLDGKWLTVLSTFQRFKLCFMKCPIYYDAMRPLRSERSSRFKKHRIDGNYGQNGLRSRRHYRLFCSHKALLLPLKTWNTMLLSFGTCLHSWLYSKVPPLKALMCMCLPQSPAREGSLVLQMKECGFRQATKPVKSRCFVSIFILFLSLFKTWTLHAT